MGLKLSGLDPHDVEYVDANNADLKSPQAKLKLSDFSPEDVEHVEAPVDPKTSPLTALTTGIIQGAVPFASALAGAGKAGMDAITGTRGPLAGEDVSDLVNDYRHARDEFSGDARTAEQANPGTALAANLVGGVANPLFKGAGGFAHTVGAGALQGLGMSDADLTKGDLAKAAGDTALGAAGGSLGYGVSRMVPGVVSGAGKIGKKALTVLGPSEEAINARFAGNAQPSAKNYSALADEMAGSLKTLSKQISDADNHAWETLSTEPSMPKQYATQPIEDAINKLKIQGKIIGGSDLRSQRVLNSLKENIDSLPNQLSESDLKSVIQSIDKNINWDDQAEKPLNNLLENVRTKLDDTLKFQNPQYKKAMAPVADRAKLLKDLKEKFNFHGVPGKGLEATDTTASKIRLNRDPSANAEIPVEGTEVSPPVEDEVAALHNKTKGDTVMQDLLKHLNEYVGKDYGDLAHNYGLSQEFEKTAPNGSRRTLLGGALGGFLGHAAVPGIGGYGGAAIGTTAGAMADRYGGQVAGNIIDSIVKAGKSDAFGKFAPVLRAAAAKGPQALAVTSSILSTNPEFKQILEGLQSQ